MPPEEVVEISKALEPAARHLMTAVTGSKTAAELDTWLAAMIGGWRIRTQLKVLAKTEERVKAAGLPAGSVPIKLLVPLLEAASLEDEDDEEMTDLWANMLASAATNVAAVPTTLPGLLKQLEPVEARALDTLVDDRGGAQGVTWAWRTTQLDAGLTQARFENLQRLGLLTVIGGDERPMFTSEGDIVLTGSPEIHVTALGVELVRACRGPVASTG